jgi:WD40 repeat protein
MSGKLFQVRKSQQNSEILYKENRENFEINLLDDFHCTITCIRIHSLYLDTHSESLVSNINFEASNNENFLDLKKNSYKIIKNFIFLSTTKGSISILYNCNQGFLRLNEFLAHPPQPENRDLRFGSLKFKAEVWSIALKEKYKNISENKLILNIFSASEDQMVKIWELNLFDLLNHKEIIKGICVGNKVKLEQNPIEKIKKILNVEEIKACKNHSLAVTSVDCKIVKIQNAEKHILATCSDDKLINIYDADDNNEFNFIANLSTKNHVVGWHTITYLSLEEVNYFLVNFFDFFKNFINFF